MLSQISIGGNACDFGQSSYVMDPDSTPENSRSADVSQRIATLDVSGTDVLVNSFDSISITELSQKEDDKDKDAVKTDNASESECPENACIAPRRRSGRNSKLSQNLATVPARNGRRETIKTASIDLSSLQITRKRRSYFSKQARSSVWGLLENTVQSFEHNVRIKIASGKRKNLRIATKGGTGNEKHGKNQNGRKSRKSKGKSSIPTGPISLKVKFGPRFLMDVIPLIDNDTNKNCTTGQELKKMPKIASEADDRLGEEVPSVQFDDCNGNLDNDYVSLSEGHQPAKNSVQDPAALVCLVESPSQEGRSSNNRFSDPGTSPDSEVINLIPDTPVDVPEDFHDLTFSKPCAAPVDAPILRMHDKSSKKGRKKERLPKVSDCAVKDSLSPESMSNAQVFENLMHGEKQRDGFSCFDTSGLTTAGNGTGNMFGTVIFSGELLRCSEVSSLGMSCASSNLESDLEGNRCSSLGTESSESGLSEKLVSSPDERKVSKGGRPKESGKSRPEISNLSEGRGSKKKGNKEKEDIVHEVKHKNDPVKCLGEVRQHSGTENGIPSGLGQVGSEKKILDGGISNLDILQSEIGEHLLPPRNAWVQCDDCLKWRRIPSLLADQIEETNCRWTCKDNLDGAFADCSFPQEKSNSEINAELEISDGSGEEDVSRAHLRSNGAGLKNPLVTHQSSWTRIKSNLFLHRNRKNQPIDEIMICHCKPPSDGRMGCGDGCLNRMLNIECARGTCPCGELCSNQQFQKRSYAKLKCFKCGKKGYGLQLLENVSKGQFLIEYVGEVLDMRDYEARQKEYALKCHKHFYFMTLNGSEVIDACAKGNLGRFINHSCDPNCRTEKWMVNGEVCIGLFASRDIKKGEEVTFDYNYVRVFGAAVKKCVCGSPICRGYIGGDPQNAEVIVQEDSDDEYPEPVVLRKDAKMDHKEDNVMCATSTINGAKIKTQRKPPKKKNTLDGLIAGDQETSCQTDINSLVGQEKVNLGNSTAVVSLNVGGERENFPDVSPALKAETCAVLKASECLSHSSAQPAETFVSLKDTFETLSGVRKGCTVAGKVAKCSISSAQDVEIISSDTVVSKSLRKSKSSNGKETHGSLKSCLFVKTSYESSLVRKGKQRNHAVNSRPLPDMDSKLQVPQPKFKKPPDGSLHGHFEAVEEKLNELLDHDGGISKRKDASRCYLKLLLLTAASGDGCNGEAIQSNRDLSMILDAILKTKSRTVLMDIINKNGLQMLHNIMKRYKREFNKIPILRKLLKVLEYLAVRDVLSPEHINGDTSRAGVESLRKSIFGLTEHEDKQVHQIARNFRDRWLLGPLRKRSCIDRDDSRISTHSGSQYDRCLASQNQWCDLGCKPAEGSEYTCHSTVASVQADAGVLDGSSASCSDIGAACRPRKRKHRSRRDQEAEAKSDPRNESDVADDQRQVLDDDVPPGFSVPVKACRVLSDDSSTVIYSTEERMCGEHPQPVVMGHLQQRFISRLPISYGIPFSEVQQFGAPQKGKFDAWTVAPGIPFQPFPPLPPYPFDRRDFVPAASNPGFICELPQNAGEDWATCSPGHLAQNPPSVSGADQPQDGNGNQLGSERASGSHNLGRKNFRKQKFNNPKLVPPWIRIRSGWEYTGNNLKNSMCIAGVASSRENEFRSTHSWVEHNLGMQNLDHALRQNTFHRY